MSKNILRRIYYNRLLNIFCEFHVLNMKTENTHEMNINFRILIILTEDSLPASGRNKIY